MKTSYLPLLLSLLAIFVFAGCQQDDIVGKNTTYHPANMTPEEYDAYIAKVELAPEKTELQITSRVPIAYIATLQNGSFPYTHTVAGDWDYANRATHDYYKIYANAGDNVTVSVERVTCEMDPATWRNTGLYADTDALPVGTFRDDELADPCCFSDPSDNWIAATGWYTIGVADFISCGPAPFDYVINVSGLSNFVLIDGCHTTVLNGQHNATTTMQEAIDNCAATAATHAAFVSCVTALTNTWVSQGKITRAQKSKIVTCAQNSSIPV